MKLRTYLKRQLKLAMLALFTAGLLVALLSPAWLRPAAALPACGHTAVDVSPAQASGPPDMAASNDEFYTALVWSEGPNTASPVGAIKLAYADALTTTFFWSPSPPLTVEQNDSQDPSIAFDPFTHTVHVAYRKDNGIQYKKCNLSNGTCAAGVDITVNDNIAGAVIHDLPQIVVMTNTTRTAVIVYQEGSGGASSESTLRYAYLDTTTPNGTLAKKNVKLTGNAENVGESLSEANPSATFSNGKIHVAYARDDNIIITPQLNEAIEYLSFNTLGAQNVAVKPFNQESGDSNPYSPTLDGRNSILGLVWQVEFGGNYYLVYNHSSDNGVTWDYNNVVDADYRHLFEHSTTRSDPWQSDLLGVNFTGGLKPTVTVGGDHELHLTWQAKTPENHDVFYGQITGDDDNPRGHGATEALSNTYSLVDYTNVTTIYRQGVLEGGTLSKVEPVVLFSEQTGAPGNRLQIAYMSKTTAGGWDIYYNGWQLKPISDTVTFNFDDTDCDGVADSNENFTCNPLIGSDPNDCDGDGIPNFMDTNSDNDFQPDSWDENPGGSSDDGGTFLPVLLKSA